MSAENGTRFGALARALQISRSVLSRHLDLLEQFGWIVRNPGHGHPLRPEYLVTQSGRPVAAWCEAAMRERERLGLQRSDLGRWSLPILCELHGSWRRFSELERGLAPITPRALSLSLAQMGEVRLVCQKSKSQFLSYGLTDRGGAFASALLS